MIVAGAIGGFLRDLAVAKARRSPPRKGRGGSRKAFPAAAIRRAPPRPRRLQRGSRRAGADPRARAGAGDEPGRDARRHHPRASGGPRRDVLQRPGTGRELRGDHGVDPAGKRPRRSARCSGRSQTARRPGADFVTLRTEVVHRAAGRLLVPAGDGARPPRPGARLHSRLQQPLRGCRLPLRADRARFRAPRGADPVHLALARQRARLRLRPREHAPIPAMPSRTVLHRHRAGSRTSARSPSSPTRWATG